MREAAIEAAKSRDEEPLKVALQEEEVIAPDRHLGGEIPPVSEDVAKPEATASELAFEDEEQTAHDTKQAVALLVVNDFAGDFKAAFDHFDRDQDAALSHEELSQLLRAAGVERAQSIAKAMIGGDELEMDSEAGLGFDGFQSAFADD